MKIKDLNYKLIITSKENNSIDITSVLRKLIWEEQPEELSMSASFELVNTKLQDKYLTSIIGPGTHVTILASQGGEFKTVFQGLVWDWTYLSSDSKILSIVAYDMLIYLQNSKDNVYFSSGAKTEDVIRTICNNWKIPFNYQIESATHSKLLYQKKTVSEMIIETLKDAEDLLGRKFVMNYTDGTLNIKPQGTNEQTYMFKAGQNAISTLNRITMSNLVTEVWVTGKPDSNGQLPKEHVESGATEKYGVLRDMVEIGSEKKEEAVKKAKRIIKEKGKPEETYSLDAIDVPFIRRGDKIHIEAGNLIGYFYVKGVSHDAFKRTMSLQVEREESS